MLEFFKIKSAELMGVEEGAAVSITRGGVARLGGASEEEGPGHGFLGSLCAPQVSLDDVFELVLFLRILIRRKEQISHSFASLAKSTLSFFLISPPTALTIVLVGSCNLSHCL